MFYREYQSKLFLALRRKDKMIIVLATEERGRRRGQRNSPYN